MDEYTKKTKAWLNERFKMCDEQGIYHAHQPIYGFQQGHCEQFQQFLLSRYVPTYEIMKALSHLEFSCLLDVGGAEGYKAALVREIFGVDVKNSDLSEQACKRAEEIFDINSDPVDIHSLPYKDNQFDVVLCSETLEHSADFHKAIDELLRVAAKSVIITVPHDPREAIENNIRKEKIHGHRWAFDINSFSFLEERGYSVFSKKMLSPYTYLHVFRRHFHKKMALAFLMTLDEFVSKLLPTYTGILIVIIKNRRTMHRKKKGKVSAYRILNFSVPKYYLKRRMDFQT